MQFTNLLRTLHIDFGAENEFLVLCIVTLSMLIIAAYLLISGRTFWHAFSGVVIALVAVLYLLDAADILDLGDINADAILRHIVSGV